MNRAEKALVLLLQVIGVILVTAVIPAVMPFAWMDQIHRELGLGALPQGPIMGYLTRSLSAMYAVHGVLILFLSWDIRRFLPVVKCLTILGVLFGIGMTILDIMVAMPPLWVLSEGPPIILLSGTLLWLTGRVGDAGTRSLSATP